MWKNAVKQDRPYMTIWRMRIACWIPKATNTHSEYVILTDCPLQQWLHERASLLHYSTLPVLFSLHSFNHEHTTTNWRPAWTLPLFSRCGSCSGRVGDLVSLTCPRPSYPSQMINSHEATHGLSTCHSDPGVRCVSNTPHDVTKRRIKN